MSWQQAHAGHLGTNIAPPEDGITLGNHPLGRVGKRWDQLLGAAPEDSKDRILRGKTFGRRGRARGLHISPGVATAEVFGKEIYRPSLRVRPFGRAEWSKITRALVRDLDTIAALLEGELPAKFMGKLEKQGIHLMPSYDELSFDCDCGDFAMPCAHVATVFQVLSQALDGDPFLLLTLRGRTRDHLLSNLRSHWGDDRAIRSVSDSIEEVPPDGDWFSSPRPIPDFACSLSGEVQEAAGLRALGPPPGESGLVGALTPLYAYGGGVSREVVAGLPDRKPNRVRPTVPVGLDGATRAQTMSTAAAGSEAGPTKSPHDRVVADVPTRPEPVVKAPEPPVDLTEVLVDMLAELDSATSVALAKSMGHPAAVIRQELMELESLGLVFQDRSGETPVWRLG